MDQQTIQQKKFDPDKIIDFRIDYYALLGVDRHFLPAGVNKKERQIITDILENAYRTNARWAHPDFGGSKEKFKTLVRAHTILSDPLLRRIYDSNGEDRPRFAQDEEGNASYEIDWSKIGQYRRGTRADTTGYGLFLEVSKKAATLGLIPAFRPKEPNHNYEWDWQIRTPEGVPPAKIALSLVFDEGEVLRLTDGASVSESLPFKIYVCIPRAYLNYERQADDWVSYGGVKWKIRGSATAAAFSDYNLLETTKFKEATQYLFGEGLSDDLAAFRNGTLVAKQKSKDKAQEMDWKEESQAKMFDGTQLKKLLKLRTWEITKEVVPDANGADFLDSIPDEVTPLDVYAPQFEKEPERQSASQRA